MKGARYASLGLALLAGCAPTEGGVEAKLQGQVPLTRIAKQQDARALIFCCPRCGREVEAGTQVCPTPACDGFGLLWPDDFTCPNCQGTTLCPACAHWNQDQQHCYYCQGSGWVRGYVACPNCEGGRCAVCKADPGKCDFCAGSGKVTQNTTRPSAPAEPEGGT